MTRKRQPGKTPSKARDQSRSAKVVSATRALSSTTTAVGGALSAFLEKAANKFGADSLKGAVVLLSLGRPIDDLIRYCEGLDDYHFAKPSDWSHCFLIAESYSGPQTKILEASIRDDKTKAILWDTDLKEMLEIISRPSGGIYELPLNYPAQGYDDSRVSPFGIKLIKSLSADDRSSIVDCGTGFLNQGYHYDLPGLFRELIRFMTGVTLPAGDKLLFCSAFVQAVYRGALGQAKGGFVEGTVESVDVTPDDIWYSKLGTPILPKDLD
jgi:hypothetical protein